MNQSELWSALESSSSLQLQLAHEIVSQSDMLAVHEERTQRQRMRRRARTFIFLSLGLWAVAGLRLWQAKRYEHELESRSTLFRQQQHRRMKEESILKYVAFGSSWTEQESGDYPLLLSSSARLVNLPLSEPVVASVCTQSILGEDSYNVILLEFQEWTPSHQILAERLRSRFPDATLILVRLWNPTRIVYENYDGTTVDLNTWKGNLTLHSNELGLTVLESGPEHWSVVLPDDADHLVAVRSQLNALVYTLPSPTAHDFNFPLNLNAFLTFFDPETFHLTPRGHSILHLGLQNVLKKVKINQYPRLGSWGTGDDCHVWYSTGQFPESTSARHLELASSDNNHKHALEIRQHDTLQVNNPFDEPRILYLTYLTSCDEHDDRVYPRVRVSLNGQAVVSIDPYHESCLYSHHLTRSSPVGVIPPGASTLAFNALETSSLNFRLVGASLLYEAAATHVDLALEPEPSLPVDSWRLW